MLKHIHTYILVSLDIICNTLEIPLSSCHYQLVCFLHSETERCLCLSVHNNKVPQSSEPPLTMCFFNPNYWCKRSILSNFLQGWNNGLLDLFFLTAFHLLHMWIIPTIYSPYQRCSDGALHLPYKLFKILLQCFLLTSNVVWNQNSLFDSSLPILWVVLALTVSVFPSDRLVQINGILHPILHRNNYISWRNVTDLHFLSPLCSPMFPYPGFYWSVLL